VPAAKGASSVDALPHEAHHGVVNSKDEDEETILKRIDELYSEIRSQKEELKVTIARSRAIGAAVQAAKDAYDKKKRQRT
jgi:hypothetical protein